MVQPAVRGVVGVTGLTKIVHGNVYEKFAIAFGPLSQAFVERSSGTTGVGLKESPARMWQRLRFGVALRTKEAVYAAVADGAPPLASQASS